MAGDFEMRHSKTMTQKCYFYHSVCTILFYSPSTASACQIFTLQIWKWTVAEIRRRVGCVHLATVPPPISATLPQARTTMPNLCSLLPLHYLMYCEACLVLGQLKTPSAQLAISSYRVTGGWRGKSYDEIQWAAQQWFGAQPYVKWLYFTVTETLKYHTCLHIHTAIVEIFLV